MEVSFVTSVLLTLNPGKRLGFDIRSILES